MLAFFFFLLQSLCLNDHKLGVWGFLNFLHKSVCKKIYILVYFTECASSVDWHYTYIHIYVHIFIDYNHLKHRLILFYFVVWFLYKQIKFSY